MEKGFRTIHLTTAWSGAVVIVALLLTLTLGEASAAKQQPRFEVPHNRLASSFLPATMISSPYFRVRETVICYGYMDSFTVDSNYGVFQVTGDGALRKLLREIQAIDTLNKVKRSDAYLEGLKKAGKQPLEFGANLVTNPVDTISGIPRGVAQLFQDVSTSVSTTANPSEDSKAAQLLSMSSAKRDLARQLGVDVYSSNTVLQRELNSLAWATALGSLTLSAALAPVGGPAVLAVSLTRTSQELNNLLADEPPARLRQMNQERLSDMRVPGDLATSFLDHPSYTPRHSTVICTSLSALGSARGRDAFIKMALSAHDEETANFFMNTAETLRGYHLGVAPIQDITVIAPILFASGSNGHVVIPFPLDYGVYTERASKLFPDVLARYQAASPAKVKKYEFWVTGTLTPLARQQLGKLGVQTVENVSKRIQFVD
jgi:hypothetical protein